jgi:hypothetical protein
MSEKMDLAQEVIKKLISSDKELTTAIKASASKLVKSKGFESAVEEAILDHIKENLMDFVNSTTLEDIAENLVKTRAEVLLKSPEVLKELDKQVIEHIKEEVISDSYIDDTLNDDEGFYRQARELVLKSARTTLHLPDPEKPKKKKRK